MHKRPRQLDLQRTIARLDVWEDFNNIDNDQDASGTGSTATPASQSNHGISASQPIPTTTTHSANNSSSHDQNKKKQEIPIVVISKLRVDKPTNQQSEVAESTTNNNDNKSNFGDQIYKKQKLECRTYTRTRSDLVWPVADTYEIKDEDLFFLTEFNSINKLNMTPDDFERLLESFELRSSKEATVAWNDMVLHIPSHFRDTYTFPLIEKIHIYWRQQRDCVKRPLLRINWKPSYNDRDPNVAFRPRNPGKMRLRRQSKQNDEEQFMKLSILKDELRRYKLLTEQIHLREQLKSLALDMKTLAFVTELFNLEKSQTVLLVDEYIDSDADLQRKRIAFEKQEKALLAQSAILSKQLEEFVVKAIPPPPIEVANSIASTGVNTLDHFLKENNSAPSNNHQQQQQQQRDRHKISQNKLLRPTGIANKENSHAAEGGKGKGKGKGIKLISDNSAQKKQQKQLQLQLQHQQQSLLPEFENMTTDRSNHTNALAGTSNQLQQYLPDSQSVKSDKQIIGPPNTNASQPAGAQTVPKLTKQERRNQLKALRKQEQQNAQAAANAMTTITNENSVSMTTTTATTTGIATTVNQKKDSSANKESNKQQQQQPSSQSTIATHKHNGAIVQPEKPATDTANQENPITIQQIEGTFTTNNIELATFLTTMYLELSKKNVDIETVCAEFDVKNFNPTALEAILANQGSELSSIIRNSRKNGHGTPSKAQSAEQFKSNNHASSSKNNNNNGNYGGNPINNINHHSASKQSNALKYQQELAQLENKKRHVLFFKTRLRLSRSGLLNIDRLLDETRNTRYEDICSKEGNYHPNKVIEAIEAKQREYERIQKEKLNVSSYTPQGTKALFAKEYFSSIRKKYQSFAESVEIEEQDIAAASMATTISERSEIGMNPQESESLQRESRISVNNDLENRQLKRSIAQGLRELQKRKSASIPNLLSFNLAQLK